MKKYKNAKNFEECLVTHLSMVSSDNQTNIIFGGMLKLTIVSHFVLGLYPFRCKLLATK